KKQKLWQEVNSLNTIVSFMNTGAHPDDENSGLLAYMSVGEGVDSSTVLANRGEGGQNEIGTEAGEGLGVIRTRELEEASKFINNDLDLLNTGFDDSITDFGFSKSPEETLEKWGKEKTYERLIKEIRQKRPDILFTSFRDVENQHGHHRAISLLTEKAFEDASDPEVFPEQLEDGLETWQPKKFYLPAEDDKEDESLRINIGGEVDPVYEKTYPQLGEEARYFHESQGMGEDLPVEDQYESLELAKSDVSDKGHEEKTIFDDIPYDFEDYANQIDDEKLESNLTNLQDDLNEIVSLYPKKQDILEKTQEVLKTSNKLNEELEEDMFSISDSKRDDLLLRLKNKNKELQNVSIESADLDITLELENNQVVKGESTEGTLIIENNGETEIPDIEIDPIVPEDWETTEANNIESIKPGDTSTVTFDIKVPEDADYFSPYEDPDVQANFSFHLMGARVEQTISTSAKEPLTVLPDFILELSPEQEIVSTQDGEQEFEVDVNVINYTDESTDAEVELEAPDDWEVTPKEEELSFTERGEEQKVSFEVSTDSDIETKDYSLNAKVVSNDNEYSEVYHPIEYDHIGQTFRPKGKAEVDAESFSLDVPEDLKVGYIDSGFDNLPNQLQRIGMDVTELTSEDLESGNLDEYDTIAVGIRGYLDREDLKENNDQLLEYVK